MWKYKDTPIGYCFHLVLVDMTYLWVNGVTLLTCVYVMTLRKSLPCIRSEWPASCQIGNQIIHLAEPQYLDRLPLCAITGRCE